MRLTTAAFHLPGLRARFCLIQGHNQGRQRGVATARRRKMRISTMVRTCRGRLPEGWHRLDQAKSSRFFPAEFPPLPPAKLPASTRSNNLEHPSFPVMPTALIGYSGFVGSNLLAQEDLQFHLSVQ